MEYILFYNDDASNEGKAIRFSFRNQVEKIVEQLDKEGKFWAIFQLEEGCGRVPEQIIYERGYKSAD